jgi:hypothetical protein
MKRRKKRIRRRDRRKGESPLLHCGEENPERPLAGVAG